MTEHFDSHCHLTATAFRDDREAVLLRAAAAGVTRVVTIASSVEDARAALRLARESAGIGQRSGGAETTRGVEATRGAEATRGEAEATRGGADEARGEPEEAPGGADDARGEAEETRAQDPTRRVRVWSTAGIHPHEAGGAAEADLEVVRELAGLPEVVALGETGLDYHYDNAPRPVQRRLFDAHLALAGELGLPVVVHARDADEDVAAALEAMPPGVSGVLHCFTGGPRAFERAAGAGWYVSFSGIASFGSFSAADMLREVPGDRLLIETDAPYLAPHPLRGRRNEPANVVHVGEAVARHLGVEPEEVARRTTENARRFYGVG